jgi:hypothetical protein
LVDVAVNYPCRYDRGIEVLEPILEGIFLPKSKGGEGREPGLPDIIEGAWPVVFFVLSGYICMMIKGYAQLQREGGLGSEKQSVEEGYCNSHVPASHALHTSPSMYTPLYTQLNHLSGPESKLSNI